MSDFAFQPHRGKAASRDDDTFDRRGHAERLRRHLTEHGHDARIETTINQHRGDKPEHRVWVQHPKYEDTFAYVTRGDAEDDKSGKYEPYWVSK